MVDPRISTLLVTLITLAIFLFRQNRDFRVLKKVLGITLFLEIFYLIGHALWGWPFPTPMAILHILLTVSLGTALGVVFSRVWPLPQVGWERVVRTLLLAIPSIGIGMALQIFLQGNRADQAIYLIFAVSAWLGSGHFVRLAHEKESKNPSLHSK